MRAGHAARRATAGEEIGKWFALLIDDSRIGVNRQPALGVKERAGDLHRVIGWRERGLAGEIAAERRTDAKGLVR